MNRSFLLMLAILHWAASSSDASSQEFETIAYWRFEQGANYLNDSSGNGHHLVDPGVVTFGVPSFSADTPLSEAGFGSAQFDGISSFTQTASPLLLAGYDRVRFSYWVKVETTTQDLMLFENSFDTNFQVNAGSTFHLLNASGTPAGSALLAYRTGSGFPSEATTLDYATYDTLDEWHNVEVDYDFTEPVKDDRVKMSVNGVEGTKSRSITRPDEWEKLRDDTLYVGGRKEFAGNPTLLFGGKLAEVKIEGVPGATLEGDFNDDQIVDGADFLVWQRGELADPVSSADLDEWRLNFGETLPSAVAGTPVPEPAALIGLMAMGGIAPLTFRRFLPRRSYY